MPIGNRAIARSADISNTMVIVFIMLIAALFGPVWSPRAGGIEAAAAEPPEGGSCVEPDASPLWTGSPAAERRAAQAMAELASAGAEGLDPADYAVAPTFQSPIAFECALNVAVRRYAEDMRRGHVRDADRGRDVLLPASDFDAASEMYSAALGGRFSQFLVDLRPLHPEYAFLRLALQRYRNIAATGGWSAVPGELDLREPVSGAALDTLRKRLAAEDIDVAADSRGDNADILPALLRYQRRNGLEADGIIGPRTLAMLNVPASERVAQIIANMERWRWLPRSFESRHVRVNVADASLQGSLTFRIVSQFCLIIGGIKFHSLNE